MQVSRLPCSRIFSINLIFCVPFEIKVSALYGYHVRLSVTWYQRLNCLLDFHEIWWCFFFLLKSRTNMSFVKTGLLTVTLCANYFLPFSFFLNILGQIRHGRISHHVAEYLRVHECRCSEYRTIGNLLPSRDRTILVKKYDKLLVKL